MNIAIAQRESDILNSQWGGWVVTQTPALIENILDTLGINRNDGEGGNSYRVNDILFREGTLFYFVIGKNIFAKVVELCYCAFDKTIVSDKLGKVDIDYSSVSIIEDILYKIREGKL